MRVASRHASLTVRLRSCCSSPGCGRRNSSSSIFAAGFNGPWGVAFDTSGNLYVANSGSVSSTVSKVTPAGVVSTFASGFNHPMGLAFDTSGNLYVANQGANTVSKVTPVVRMVLPSVWLTLKFISSRRDNLRLRRMFSRTRS